MPLETPLRAVTEDGTARLLDGDRLIVETRRVPEFEIEVPEAVTRRRPATR